MSDRPAAGGIVSGMGNTEHEVTVTVTDDGAVQVRCLLPHGGSNLLTAHSRFRSVASRLLSERLPAAEDALRISRHAETATGAGTGPVPLYTVQGRSQWSDLLRNAGCLQAVRVHDGTADTRSGFSCNGEPVRLRSATLLQRRVLRTLGAVSDATLQAVCAAPAPVLGTYMAFERRRVVLRAEGRGHPQRSVDVLQALLDAWAASSAGQRLLLAEVGPTWPANLPDLLATCGDILTATLTGPPAARR